MIINKKCLYFDNHSIDYKPINIIFTKKQKEPFFCKSMYQILTSYKSSIDNINNTKKWDHTKKISNEYELINQNGINTITSVNPLSRSYYKFWEIIKDFNLVSNEQHKIRYAALAEGPGGFIEAFIDYRKRDFLGKQDYIQCMTLLSKTNDIPNWNKAKKLFKFSNINYCTGKDRTGNLYNPDNIVYFRRGMGGNTADIVSADGGFDYSSDFNKQEQMSQKLIFSEIICAYATNKPGGHFVLKIFDIYNLATIKLIYLVSYFYKNIILVKPNTSRPANSEKYIVCRQFKGFREDIFNNLLLNLSKWDNDNIFISDIHNIDVPSSFVYYLSIYNHYLIKNQIKNILKTLIFIDSDFDCEEIKKIKNIQILYAKLWCQKYGIKINNNFINF